MNKALMVVEALSVVLGTLAALAGEIDFAILFWVIAIFMAIKEQQ